MTSIHPSATILEKILHSHSFDISCLDWKTDMLRYIIGIPDKLDTQLLMREIRSKLSNDFYISLEKFEIGCEWRTNLVLVQK
jgi:hypothetical protein